MKKIRNNHSSLSTTLLVYHRWLSMARIYCRFTQEKKTKRAPIKRATIGALAMNIVQ